MNIGRLLNDTAAAHPDRLATQQGERKQDYRQFNARVNRLAHALTRLGATPGKNVAILMTNVPEMLEAMFAIFKIGCGAVPINFRLHPLEIAYIITHSQSPVLITEESFQSPLKEVREDLAGLRYTISTGHGTEGVFSYESIVAAESDSYREVDVDPDHVAWLFYTSGTTGQPKGAMLTHRNLLGMTERFHQDILRDPGDDEVVLHAAPLSHGSGLYALPNVENAATHLFLETSSFNAEKVLRLFAEERVTNLFAAPAMITRLLDCPSIAPNSAPALKAFVYGGAPMMVHDLTRAIRIFPNLVQIYGLGETPMTITSLCQDEHVVDGDDTQAHRLASAGRPRTGVDVMVVDGDGRRLPTGQIGEVVTRSDVVTKGYWRDRDATEKALRDGWLHTGDMGHFDEDGYLYLSDRSKDMIISGGENIYPREIEEVLTRHDAVREVAVIGVPDEEWGEAVKAIVVLNPNQQVSFNELIQYCQDHIASFKKPKSIDFLDDLPKNNYGKVLKRELRKPYWPEENRQI